MSLLVSDTPSLDDVADVATLIGHLSVIAHVAAHLRCRGKWFAWEHVGYSGRCSLIH